MSEFKPDFRECPHTSNTKCRFHWNELFTGDIFCANHKVWKLDIPNPLFQRFNVLKFPIYNFNIHLSFDDTFNAWLPSWQTDSKGRWAKLVRTVVWKIYARNNRDSNLAKKLIRDYYNAVSYSHRTVLF